MPGFPEIFTIGGDEVLPLDPVKGHNKYFITPYVDEHSIVRSSCTCSSPTLLGYKAAEYHYNKLVSGETNVHDIMEGIRNELMRMYELPEGTGIIFTPSGTDAQFIPILIARALNPKKEKILNIVTGKGEIGTGTIRAAKGTFISSKDPIPGYQSMLGFGGTPDTPIGGLHGGLTVLALEARDHSG